MKVLMRKVNFQHRPLPFITCARIHCIWQPSVRLVRPYNVHAYIQKWHYRYKRPMLKRLLIDKLSGRLQFITIIVITTHIYTRNTRNSSVIIRIAFFLLHSIRKYNICNMYVKCFVARRPEFGLAIDNFRHSRMTASERKTASSWNEPKYIEIRNKIIIWRIGWREQYAETA